MSALEDYPLQKKVVALAEKSFNESIGTVIIGVLVGGILLCVAASNVISNDPEPFIEILESRWPDHTTEFSIQFIGFYFLSAAVVHFFAAILTIQLKLATLQMNCTKLEIISYLELGLGLAMQLGIIYAVWYYWMFLSITAKLYCGISLGSGVVMDTRRFLLLQRYVTECRENSTDFVAV